jgi:phosphate:Na+ symporter
LRFSTRPQGTVTELYDGLRTQIARIIVEIHKLELDLPENRSVLWLDQESAQVEHDLHSTTLRVEKLIRRGKLKPDAATSFLNDSGYAYNAMRDLIKASRSYYIERDSSMAEVEKLLSKKTSALETFTPNINVMKIASMRIGVAMNESELEICRWA